MRRSSGHFSFYCTARLDIATRGRKTDPAEPGERGVKQIMENTERKSVAQLAKVAAPQRDCPAPSLADAQAGSKREAEFQAERMNSDLTHRYLLNFGGWKTEVLAGKRDNKTPPQPP